MNDTNTHSANLKEVNSQEYREAIKSGYTFVDYWAEWCGPCRMVAPTIDKLADEWMGKIKFLKVNIDENPDVAQELMIMSIPHFILFKDGEIVNRFTYGAAPKHVFDAFIKDNYTEEVVNNSQDLKAA